MPFGRPPLSNALATTSSGRAARCPWSSGEGSHADGQHDGSFGRVRHRKRGGVQIGRDRAGRQSPVNAARTGSDTAVPPAAAAAGAVATGAVYPLRRVDCQAPPRVGLHGDLVEPAIRARVRRPEPDQIVRVALAENLGHRGIRAVRVHHRTSAGPVRQHLQRTLPLEVVLGGAGGRVGHVDGPQRRAGPALTGPTLTRPDGSSE